MSKYKGQRNKTKTLGKINPLVKSLHQPSDSKKVTQYSSASKSKLCVQIGLFFKDFIFVTNFFPDTNGSTCVPKLDTFFSTSFLFDYGVIAFFLDLSSNILTSISVSFPYDRLIIENSGKLERKESEQYSAFKRE